MTRTTKILLAASALAIAVGTAAVAGGNWRHHGGMGAMGMGGEDRFAAADADNSGDVTAQEFAAAFDKRIGGADANADGVYAPEEIAAEIERQRALQMAARLIQRFDSDGDGKLSKAEVDNQRQRMFTMLDRNGDGKIVKDEMPRRGMQDGWGGGRYGGWGHRGWGQGGPAQ